jgi:hypothetical protein
MLIEDLLFLLSILAGVMGLFSALLSRSKEISISEKENFKSIALYSWSVAYLFLFFSRYVLVANLTKQLLP